MDDLRENIQLEKLRALKPVADMADNQGPQRKLGLTSTKKEPKAMGKELQDEVLLPACSPGVCASPFLLLRLLARPAHMHITPRQPQKTFVARASGAADGETEVYLGGGIGAGQTCEMDVGSLERT